MIEIKIEQKDDRARKYPGSNDDNCCCVKKSLQPVRCISHRRKRLGFQKEHTVVNLCAEERSDGNSHYANENANTPDYEQHEYRAKRRQTPPDGNNVLIICGGFAEYFVRYNSA